MLRSQPASLAAPANSGGSRNLIFISDPALPAGLVLDNASGAIYGTPTAAAAATTYTLTARGTGGNSSVDVRIRVHPHPTLQLVTNAAAASALCGPTTGATSLDLQTSFPMSNLSVGDRSTVRCHSKYSHSKSYRALVQ